MAKGSPNRIDVGSLIVLDLQINGVGFLVPECSEEGLGCEGDRIESFAGGAA